MREAILDLPQPFEPVFVDLDRPLEDQLPAGAVLEAAKKCLKDYPEPYMVINPHGT